MKSVDRNLYNRNGYYYFRSRLPQFYASIINRKEITIALGTKNYSDAKLQSAKMNYSFDIIINSHDLENIDIVLQLKETAGIQPLRKPAYMTSRGYKAHKQSNIKNLCFSQISKDYLESSQNETTATTNKKRAIFKIFQEIMGDMPFHSIQKVHAREFKKLLLKIPPNFTKYKKISSYADIDWKKLPDSTQSPRTINFKLTCMVTLFNWAKNNDLFIGDNPFSNLNIKGIKTAKSDRRPFTKEELDTLFSSPVYKGSQSHTGANRLLKGNIRLQDSYYWVPLIALYTGMRMNEICQLKTSDIKQVDDIWCIDINDKGDNRLKNQSSIRVIPIHHKLISLGFIKYIDTCNERVFEDIPMGHNGTYSYIFSKRFARLLKSLELNNQNLCFHSFRHNFIDALRAVNVNRDIIMRLVGHSSSHKIHDNYGSGYSLGMLSENINKLNYEIEV